MIEVTSIELVKWTDAYTTKRKQRERESYRAVLAARGSYLCCAGRRGHLPLDGDRAGRRASVQTGGNYDRFACLEPNPRPDSTGAGGPQEASRPLPRRGLLVWDGIQRTTHGKR